MPQKTYVHRTTFEVLVQVDDHRDINFPDSEWSREPSGLDALLSAAVPRRYWIFDPPGGNALRQMTTAEKNVVDAEPGRVAAARARRKEELFSLVAKFIENRYSARVRMVFAELRPGAGGAMAAQLDNYFTWHRRAWSAYRQAAAAINAANSVPVVEAVTIDFAPVAAQDPGVSIEQTAP